MNVMNQATISANTLSESHNCFLGLSNFDLCSYNPGDPTVYFSLGSAIAGLGIIFAAYQLSRESWWVLLDIKGWWAKNIIWILSCSAVILVIVASIIPQIPLSNSNIFNYPLFYEILATFLFILGPIIFIFKATHKKNLFNEKNAEQFSKILLRELGRSYPRKNEIIVDIVNENLTNIVSAAKGYIKKTIENEDKGKEVNHFGKYAVEVLNLIISDKEIARYIAIKRYDFLYLFFEKLKNNPDLRKEVCDLGVDSIVNQLFLNDESYLYRQMEEGGLSLVKNNIYYYLFHKQNIFSKFDPLEQWQGMQIYEDTNDLYYTFKYLKAFLFSFQRAVEGYFEEHKIKNNPNFRTLEIFKKSFDKLLDRYSRSLILDYNNNKLNKEFLFDRLKIVSDFLTRDILSVYEKYSEDNSFDSEVKDYNGEDFNQIYANSLVEFIEILSMIKISEKDEENMIFPLGTNLSIGGPIREDQKYEDIRKKFEKLSWIKIEDNVDRKFFPAFLRIYILFFIRRPKLQERDNLVHYMYKNLKHKFLNEERMLNDELMERELLPTNVEFNHNDGNFYLVGKDGNKKHIK